MQQTVFSWLDSQEKNAVAFLKELIGFDSVAADCDDPLTPQGKRVAACLDAALAKAEKLGLKTHNLDGWAGLIDLGEGEAKFGMLCHLDIVPAGDGWTHAPFAGEIEDGILYGRGASDDKGPFVSALFALAALKACKVPLTHSVRLICGTCEETGSADIAYCKKKKVIPPHVFSPDASFPVVNTEKGIFRFTLNAPLPEGSALKVLSGGEVLNMVPQSAYAVLEDGRNFSASGRAAHASTPELGENAISKLLTDLCEHLKDDPSYPLLRMAASLHPPSQTDGSSLGIAEEEPIAGKLSANLGLAGLSNGVLSLSFDVRYPLNVTGDSLVHRLTERLKDTPFSLVPLHDMPPHHVPEDSPLVTCLLRSYTEVTGKDGYCIAIGGGTYVHDIDGSVAFGTVHPGEDCRIHSPDEFIRIKDLIENAKIFAAALLHLQNENL